MADNQLRILTYNLHKGFNTGNRQFILHEMREALNLTDADVLLLQEIQGEHVGHEQNHAHWPDCPHCEFIAQDVWPHFAYAKNAVRSSPMLFSANTPWSAGKTLIFRPTAGPAAVFCMA